MSMNGKLKVYQMNLDGEIDAAKMAEINRVIGQLIKGEMYGLILNFASVEHIHFTILTSLVEEKRFPTISRIFSAQRECWRSSRFSTQSSRLQRVSALQSRQRTCRWGCEARFGNGNAGIGVRKREKKARDNAPNSELNTPQGVHVPVLLHEAVDLLAPHPGGVYVDGTIGGAGHATLILERSAPDGLLIGMDQDADAIERCKAVLAGFGNRVVLVHANYRDMKTVLRGAGYEKVDGVLLDLGVSWFHIRERDRGFSFQADGPLDMRMDRRLQRTAADLVNSLSPRELAEIIREYGEEQKAGSIARAIEKARARRPITSTIQLSEVVSSVFPPYPPRRIHPATLTFQALRIAVNDELGALREGIVKAVDVLKPGGRAAVITFHSLEDRIVKQAFASAAKGCVCPPKLPVCACGKKPVLRILTPRPVKPGAAETAANPAARSAKLRGAEKLL
jgi:16S rRNA (cytosine1402-N4)-methyltransferase